MCQLSAPLGAFSYRDQVRVRVFICCSALTDGDNDKKWKIYCFIFERNFLSTFRTLFFTEIIMRNHFVMIVGSCTLWVDFTIVPLPYLLHFLLWMVEKSVVVPLLEQLQLAQFNIELTYMSFYLWSLMTC